jgi:hypothetical protein
MGTDPSAQFLSQFPARVTIAPSTSAASTISGAPSNGMTAHPTGTEDKAKRLTACLVCRKRKLKCDSARPKCASCTRLGHAWYIP